MNSSTRQGCGIVEEREGRQDQGQHRPAPIQRLAKSRLDLSSKDGGRLMVGRVCEVLARRGRPAGGVCRPVSVPWRLRQDGRQPETPDPSTEHRENREQKPRDTLGAIMWSVVGGFLTEGKEHTEDRPGEKRSGRSQPPRAGL